jgi:hypothetical protein
MLPVSATPNVGQTLSRRAFQGGVTLGVRCFSIVLLHLCKASHKLFYDKYFVMQSRHTHADGKLLIA